MRKTGPMFGGGSLQSQAVTGESHVTDVTGLEVKQNAQLAHVLALNHLSMNQRPLQACPPVEKP
jgi:hypothetical protein